jgi:ATP-dependent DNA ligase
LPAAAAGDPSSARGAVQTGLHPAESRIKKFSIETPDIFTAFDLGATGKNVSAEPFHLRRKALSDISARVHRPGS